MNKFIGIGRFTKSPEISYTQTSNTALCKFTLAIDRRFKKDGEATADFLNCIAWRKTAEFIAKYFDKGNKIAVVGSVQTRNWEDNDGKKHYATEIIVDEAYFVENKSQCEREIESQVSKKVDASMGVDVLDDMADFESELPF